MRPALAVAILALSAVPLSAVVAQYSTEGKPARSLLHGRRETATVELTRLGTSTIDDQLPWRHRSPPLSVTTGTSARLWTDLPITIDTLRVPPGTYVLRLETPRTLLVVSELPPGSDAARFTGRAQMSEGPSGVNVLGWSFAVVTSRIAEDTVSFAEGQTSGMQVLNIRHGPGTRSKLRLRWQDRELAATISAR